MNTQGMERERRGQGHSSGKGISKGHEQAQKTKPVLKEGGENGEDEHDETDEYNARGVKQCQKVQDN